MKTVLLAMNNPQSDDPRHVLYPYPPGCAGHRLWTMMKEAGERCGVNIYKQHYLDGFERINLLHSRVWNAKAAKLNLPKIMERINRRRVIMCGATVPKIVGVHWDDWCSWDQLLGPYSNGEYEFQADFCVIPHPSGRCREYNSSEMREEVGDLLLQEYARGTGDARVKLGT